MTLKEARKKVLKLTQEQMAQQIGVSVRTWARYENNGCPAPVLKLVSMMVSHRATPSSQSR